MRKKKNHEAPCKSFYDIKPRFWHAKDSRNNRPFDRLCSMMRMMRVKHYLVDILSSDDKEISAEINGLNSYFGRKVETKIFKLTFISQCIRTRQDIKNVDQNKYLASAIVVNLKFPDTKLGTALKEQNNNSWLSYLYRAVVTTPKIFIDNKDYPLPNYYLHVSNKFDCHVKLNERKKVKFTIEGTSFLQQNGLTSVCAHAAVCMILQNLKGKSFNDFMPEDVNKMLRITHRKENKLKDGLNNQQIEEVFKKLDLKTMEFDFIKHPEYNYATYIYHHIEGGNPSLLAFSTNKPYEKHIVPIFGHTLNTHIWDAEAELFYNADGADSQLAYEREENGNRLRQTTSSSPWADHFIMHDDNYGMYLNLPVDALKKQVLPKHDMHYRACLAISVVPKNVLTNGFEAESMCANFIRQILPLMKRDGVWVDKWIKRMNDTKTPIVIRTLLANKKEYKKHLTRQRDFTNTAFSKNEISLLVERLPRHFWLCEVTLPDLYTANQSKLFDFIYSSEKRSTLDLKEKYKKIIQIRFTGAVFFPNKRNFKQKKINVKSHFPLFRLSSEQDIPLC